MKIVKHRLVKEDGNAYQYVRSPNRGGKVKHEFLVIHFTAGRSAESSVSWLANPHAKASAHLVIGRDGSITQLVPFDTVAWHAGQSAWENRVGLNRYSLGIELDNAGRLTRVGTKWRTWFGTEVPDDEVIEAVHKNQTQPSSWHTFTEAQIKAVQEVAGLLVEHYGLVDVVGHDDIAPGRKSDPGPAFPLASVRAQVLGRAEDETVYHETTTKLNIRSGPGTQHVTIDGSPLPKGKRVLILKEQGSWRFVDVLKTVNGVMDVQGWVHGRYLKRVA
jgi:N-acetylmuramoyl-L-alanine amidase